MTTISLQDLATPEDPAGVGPVEKSREFWRGVLLAGGPTAVPRWALDPVPGVGEHEAAIPVDLAAALRRRADELAIPGDDFGHELRHDDLGIRADRS